MSSKLTVKIPGENEDQPENIKELKPRKPRNKRRYKTRKTQATRKSNRLSIAFLLWSDQGLQMDNLEQTMDHTNLLDSLSENFSIPIGIVLALMALFFYV